MCCILLHLLAQPARGKGRVSQERSAALTRVASSCRSSSGPCQGEGGLRFERAHRNFDEILSKLEGTRGSPRGLQWTLQFVQLLETTEKISGDARLPVG